MATKVLALTLLLTAEVAAQDDRSAGPDVSVPSVAGQSAQDASKRLREAGLVPSFVLGDAAPAQDESFVASDQKPAAGRRVPRGTRIVVTIYDAAPDSAPATRPRPARKVARPVADGPRTSIIDHVRTGDELVAFDLGHGSGARRLSVVRTWMGTAAAESAFGVGWADRNRIVQTQLGDSQLLLWRGGELIVSASRDGNGFSAGGGVTVQRLPSGWVWSTRRGERLQFDDRGQLVEQQSAFGQVTQYLWDQQGRLTQIAQDAGNSLRYLYDGGSDRVSRIEGPEGLHCDYSYNEQGRLLTATTSRGIDVSYAYRADGSLAAVTDSLGGRIELPEVNQPDDSTDAQKTEEAVAEVQKRRDELTLAERLGAIDRRSRPKPVIVRNEQGQVTERTHRGVTTRYEYDDAGRLKTVTDPTGVRQLSYDDFDRIASVDLPTGQTLTYQYNSFDRVTRIDSSDGRWVAVDYDDHVRPTEWTSSLQSTVTADYGPTGFYGVLQWSPELKGTMTYSGDGDLLHAAMSTGRELVMAYDEQRRLTDLVSSTGLDQQLIYDDQGRPISWRINGLTRLLHYENGRLTGIADDVFGQRKFNYEKADDGTIELTWDDLGTWTRQTNEWGQPMLFRRPSGQTWQYSWNAQQFLSGMTTPLERSWQFDRDAAGRLAAIRMPGGAATEIERAPAGRVTRIVRNGTTQREFLYGPDGRTRMTSTPLGIAAVYSWEPSGQIREVVLPDGKAAWTFNDSGLAERVTGPEFDIQQQFHPNGRLARRSYKRQQLDVVLPLDTQGRSGGIELNGVAAGYQYGEDGWLQRIDLPDGSAITIQRDLAGRPIAFAFGNTASMTVNLDQASRMRSLNVVDLQGRALFDERYEYDAAGNLVELQTDQLPVSRHSFDADDRLTRVERAEHVTSYEYSLDDDLRAVSTDGETSQWELDAAGRPRLLNLDVVYDWDAAGNLTSVQSVSTDAENEFDAAGRLVRRRLAGLEWKFGYLPDGTRLWQEGPAGRISYAYGRDGLIGLRDESGTTWLLVCLPESGQPLALCSSQGEVLYLCADRLGSIRRVIDPSGVVIASSDYGPYGATETAAGFSPINLYAGMLVDEHGVYYARQRYYDPQLCRFISLDPQPGTPGFPGSFNPLAYAACNPLRYRDETGAAPRDFDGEPVTADNFWQVGFEDWKRQEDRRSTPEERAARNQAINQALVDGATSAGQELLNDALASSGAMLNELSNTAAGLIPWDPVALAAQTTQMLEDAPNASTDVGGSTTSPGTTPSSAVGTTASGPNPAIDFLDFVVTGLPNEIMGPTNDILNPGSSLNSDDSSLVASDSATAGDPSSGAAAGASTSSPSSPSGNDNAAGNPATARNSSGNSGGNGQTSGLPVANSGNAAGRTPATPSSGGDIIGRLLNDLADADRTSIPARWDRRLRNVLKRQRRLLTPTARNLNLNQILDLVSRNLTSGSPRPFDGVLLPAAADSDQAIGLAAALNKARVLAVRGQNLERDLNKATQQFDDTSRRINDLIDRLLGEDGLENRLLGIRLQIQNGSTFAAASNDLDRMKKWIAEVRAAEASDSPVQDALHYATQARDQICGWVKNGYDPKDSATLRSKAGDLLTTARSALDRANEANRDAGAPQGNDGPKTTLQTALDELTKATNRAEERIPLLEPLPDLRDAFEEVRGEYKALRSELVEVGRKFEDLNAIDAKEKSTREQLLATAAEIRTLLADYWYSPDALTFLNLADRWTSQFDSQIDATPAQAQRLKSFAENRLPLMFLDDVDRHVPRDARDRLADIKATIKEARELLNQDREKKGKQLDDALAGAYRAWELIREAEGCRDRILSAPSNRPLTGNVQAFELLKSLNPRVARLRPRHSESLIPGHPFSALGHPLLPESNAESRRIMVPDVVGLSAADAVKKIRDAGLLPKIGSGEAKKSSAKPFHVFEQSPTAATAIARGGSVSITVAMQPPTVASRTPESPTKRPTKPIAEPTPKKEMPAPKASVDRELEGSYALKSKFNFLSSGFDWKQLDSNRAQVTFRLDGSEAAVLKKYGLKDSATVIAVRKGDHYEVGEDNPLTAMMDKVSATVTQELTGSTDNAVPTHWSFTFIPMGKSITLNTKGLNPTSGVAARK